MEAEVDFYAAVDAAAAAQVGAIVHKNDTDPAGLTADEVATLATERAKAVVRKVGLPHASLGEDSC